MESTTTATRVAVLAAVWLVTAPLAAQRNPARAGPLQVWRYLAEQHDKNGDGRITAEEYGRGTDKFAAYDRNGDGVLTADDFRNGLARRRAAAPAPRIDLRTAFAKELLRSADDNADDKVTEPEWKARLKALDADGNGRIDAAELRAPMLAALRRDTLSDRALLRRARVLDRNGDGVVQPGELAPLFATLDRDHNGWLDRDELGGAAPRPSGPPKVGAMAPDFDLPRVGDAKSRVRLSSFRGKQPVALIFGSYT
ncbi:MAG: hypothetical protein KDC87_16715 [Planctomycetes bacterium]|nr:hypothetical protein [Planctomycetota bacterium]